MEKLTLHFIALPELAAFAKTLCGGYLLNTTNLTLTARMPVLQSNLALDLYHATLIETTEKVFSYQFLK